MRARPQHYKVIMHSFSFPSSTAPNLFLGSLIHLFSSLVAEVVDPFLDLIRDGEPPRAQRPRHHRVSARLQRGRKDALSFNLNLHSSSFPRFQITDDLAIDELIRRLKTLAHTFQTLSQADDESTYSDYTPLAIHLADEGFLNHSSRDVQLLIACCIADILRIFAPEAPYKDPLQIRVIHN
jgi:hypothetical protein